MGNFIKRYVAISVAVNTALFLILISSAFAQSQNYSKTSNEDRFQKYLYRVHGPDYQKKRTVASLDTSKVEVLPNGIEQTNANLAKSQQDVLSVAAELSMIHDLKSQLQECGTIRGYKITNCGDNDKINGEIKQHQAGVKGLVKDIQGRGTSLSTTCQSLIKGQQSISASSSDQNQMNWVQQACANNPAD